jgi:hypothetical protein
MTSDSIYEITEDIKEDEIQYLFMSEGEKRIIKIIQYSYVLDMHGKRVFNLGFGNYDIENDSVIDDVNTNNGDVYKVFNTVLGTVPRFFEVNKDAAIMVAGSDNGAEFTEKCRLSCKKKCGDICKNINRRMNIYRGYVDKNFKELNKEYVFHGGDFDINNQSVTEEYRVGERYSTVFLMKKND